MKIKRKKTEVARGVHLIDNMAAGHPDFKSHFTGTTPPIPGAKLTQLFTQDLFKS